MDRIIALRKALAQSGGTLAESDPLRKNISDFDGKVDVVRKKIVATTEGGAITGEERLREHTDQLYGAILNYEEKPGGYQVAYTDALKRESMTDKRVRPTARQGSADLKRNSPKPRDSNQSQRRQRVLARQTLHMVRVARWAVGVPFSSRPFSAFLTKSVSSGDTVLGCWTNFFVMLACMPSWGV